MNQAFKEKLINGKGSQSRRLFFKCLYHPSIKKIYIQLQGITDMSMFLPVYPKEINNVKTEGRLNKSEGKAEEKWR